LHGQAIVLPAQIGELEGDVALMVSRHVKLLQANKHHDTHCSITAPTVYHATQSVRVTARRTFLALAFFFTGSSSSPPSAWASAVASAPSSAALSLFLPDCSGAEEEAPLGAERLCKMYCTSCSWVKDRSSASLGETVVGAAAEQQRGLNLLRSYQDKR
jgi:hypothetical protein